MASLNPGFVMYIQSDKAQQNLLRIHDLNDCTLQIEKIGLNVETLYGDNHAGSDCNSARLTCFWMFQLCFLHWLD